MSFKISIATMTDEQHQAFCHNLNGPYHDHVQQEHQGEPLPLEKCKTCERLFNEAMQKAGIYWGDGTNN